jgi:hypothetical protein
MIHVFDVLKAPFKACVVGKGPSFSRDKVLQKQAEGYFICSVNNTYEIGSFRADLVVFNDWSTLRLLKQQDAVNIFATCSAPHWNVLPSALSVDATIEFGRLFEALGPKLAVYDMHHRKLFPQHPSVESIGSSAEAAVHILAHLGTKHFAFIGVDNTSDYHSSFKQHAGNFYGCVEHFKRLKRLYNLTYEGMDV